MGFLAKRSNARKTEPLAMPVGSWIDDLHGAMPFLPKDELPGWAGISTVLTTPTSSNTSVMPDGRQNSIARWLREQPSIVRFASTPGAVTTVDLGGIRGLGEWKQDWSLRFAPSEGNHHYIADVPAYATSDDLLVNPDSLDRTRTTLAETLAQGPTVHVHEARPDPSNLLATIRLDYSGPLTNDFYMPSHPSVAEAREIPIASQTLVEAAQFFRFRTGPGTDPDTVVLYLAPDADPAHGTLLVHRTGADSCTITAPAVDGDMATQVRWKRRLATALNWLSISKKLAAAATPLEEFRDAAVGKTETKEGWQAVWTDQILAPAWPLPPSGGEFPVCVRLRSERGFNGADCGRRAMDSVATYRRGFGGVTGRNTMWGSRRPSYLTLDQGKSILPRVRFGCHTEDSDAVVGAVVPSPAHFWEVHWGMVGDSWNDTVLTITGMTRMRDLLPYGQELLAFLDAYCDLALGYDPDIQFTTVSVAY